MRVIFSLVILCAVLRPASAADRVAPTHLRARLAETRDAIAGKLLELVGNARETIGEVFGTEAVWDRTYEFEVPEVFRGISMDTFARWYNGALVETEGEEGRRARETERRLDEGASELEILNLVQQGEGELGKAEGEAAEGIPAKYDFYEKYPACLTEEYNQGSCGSCWAFATALTVTTRLCKTIVDKNLQMPYRGYRLSPQPLVSCGGADTCPNGCCNGGWVFAALNWVKNHQLFPMSCYEYESWHGGEETDLCLEEKKDCLDEAKHTEFKKKSLWGARKDPMHAIRVSIKEFATVGNSVEAMQREIMKNGPIASKIRTASNLMGFNGKGVFTRGDKPWLKKGEMHAYHAWVIHGWDEESWLVTNSWGDIYHKRPKGLRHTLRVKKGSNELLIESLSKHSAVPAIRTGDARDQVVSVEEGWPASGTYKISQLAVSGSVSSGDANNDNSEAETVDPKIADETRRVIAETQEFLKEQGISDVGDN